jgi:hypothetical protein
MAFVVQLALALLDDKGLHPNFVLETPGWQK